MTSFFTMVYCLRPLPTNNTSGRTISDMKFAQVCGHHPTNVYLQILVCSYHPHLVVSIIWWYSLSDLFRGNIAGILQDSPPHCKGWWMVLGRHSSNHGLGNMTATSKLKNSSIQILQGMSNVQSVWQGTKGFPTHRVAYVHCQLFPKAIQFGRSFSGCKKLTL